MIYSDFIYGRFIDNTLCDELILFYENNEFKEPGKLGGGNIDKDKKDSMDVGVNPNYNSFVIQRYMNQLNDVCREYINKYEYSSKDHSAWGIVENFNIQKYLPNQGFKIWHYERTGPTGSTKSVKRHLVFMTYLNNIDDGGETEWYYQNLKIKPRKGLTVIWPADWTFTHRGLTSFTETKYIATGWYSFLGD